MYEIKAYELLSQKECSKVARLDAPSQILASGSQTQSLIEEYVQKNHLTYYILCNTWLNLAKDYAPYGWARLASMIVDDGLIHTIKWASECADHIVHRDCESLDSDEYPLAAYMLREIRLTGRPNTAMLFPEYNIGREPMATLLCILRYPKRFSPQGNTAIQAASTSDFLKYERRTRALQRSQSGRFTHDIGYSHYVVSKLRDIIYALYDWDAICDEIEEMDITDIEFSSGAGFDSKASLGSKLLATWRKHPEYFYRPFGAYVVPMQTREPDGEVRMAAVQAVPKSYKASRMIAMEDTYRLAYCKHIESIFRKHDRINREINIEDQTINQLLAQEGSETGRYATLDASHASDLISMSLFHELFPHRYVSLILPYLATHYQVAGKIYRKEMLSTSGHTLTFRHETIVYKAVALLASSLHRLFSEQDVSAAFGWAYGDDTIVETDCAQLAMELFGAIGLIINESKSFYSSKPGYRESCGEEYCKGVVMTSVYYPRFPVLGTLEPISLRSDRLFNDSYRGKIDDSTTMLIDLQKKLFPISVAASRFVYCIVKQAHPRMTSSPYGYICPDLWDVDDSGITRVPKAYHLVTTNIFLTRHICGTDINFLVGHEKTPVGDCVEDDELIRLARKDTYHYAPYVAYAGKSEYSDLEVECYEMYSYMHFLKHGPTYNSALDRLLGVTQPRPSIASFYGKRRMAWRLQLVDFTR